MNEIREKYHNICDERKIENRNLIRWLFVVDISGKQETLIELKSFLKSNGRPADIIFVTRESDCPKSVLRKLNYDAYFFYYSY